MRQRLLILNKKKLNKKIIFKQLSIIIAIKTSQSKKSNVSVLTAYKVETIHYQTIHPNLNNLKLHTKYYPSPKMVTNQLILDQFITPPKLLPQPNSYSLLNPQLNNPPSYYCTQIIPPPLYRLLCIPPHF